MVKTHVKDIMLVEGMTQELATRYIKTYETIIDKIGQISSLGSAIQRVALSGEFDEYAMSCLGQIVDETSDEILHLIDDFVSYPIIYTTIRERGKI